MSDSDWSYGYFTDSQYIYGYYRELNPVFQRFCLLIHGVIPPEQDADFNYCELGFGQGVSINIHAAAQPGNFFGTDFNPAQTSHAKKLSRIAGSSTHLYDDSFAEFLQRDDLPQFDSINLHGVWSWISRENQQLIVDFVRKFLKPGGTLYNSYNCFPGWAPYAPLRELFYLYDRFNKTEPDTNVRVQAALKFAQDLVAQHPAYEQHVPTLAKRLENISKHNPHYLAHEYLNRDWICMYFAEVAEVLTEAKLNFVGTAAPMEIVNSINLKQEDVDFLNSIHNLILREQVKDYILNQQFRRDLYIRGLNRLKVAELQQRILTTRFCINSIGDMPTKIESRKGSFNLKPEIYEPICEYLAQDNYRPKTFASYLAEHPKLPYLSLEVALVILVGMNYIAPCQSEQNVQKVRPRCDALNAHICECSKLSNDFSFLASPETGGGFPLGRFEQLFTAFVFENSTLSAEELALKVWKVLQRNNELILKEGKALETAEENIAEIKSKAETYLTKIVPILKGVKILP